MKTRFDKKGVFVTKYFIIKMRIGLYKLIIYHNILDSYSLNIITLLYTYYDEGNARTIIIYGGVNAIRHRN